MKLTAMRHLTSLSLSNVSHDVPEGEVRPTMHQQIATVLASLPNLLQLTVMDAYPNFLSELNAPLTNLIFSLRSYTSLDVALLARLTTLQTLVCIGCRTSEAKQVRALTHIPNLIVR